jgi:hypothetical protein
MCFSECLETTEYYMIYIYICTYVHIQWEARPSFRYIHVYIYICIQVIRPRLSAQPTGTGLILLKGVVHILSV